MSSPIDANAWFGKKKDDRSAAPAASEKKAAVPADKKKSDRALDAAIRNKKEAAQKKLAQLNNTEWTIEMSPLNGKGKKELDIVTFKNNQVSVAGFTKRGFPTTNFTLSVQDDDIVVWETMQTAEKGGIAFWRGEMDMAMQSMRGVVSHHIDEKTKADYSFASTEKKSIPGSGN
jgi:hypothetical protein